MKPAYYSPKGPFLSEALDSADSVRFSKFERFELLMNFSGKGFCGFSRTGESVRFQIRQFEVRILRPSHAVLQLETMSHGAFLGDSRTASEAPSVGENVDGGGL